MTYSNNIDLHWAKIENLQYIEILNEVNTACDRLESHINREKHNKIEQQWNIIMSNMQSPNKSTLKSIEEINTVCDKIEQQYVILRLSIVEDYFHRLQSYNKKRHEL